jgi:hypothetical protein
MKNVFQLDSLDYKPLVDLLPSDVISPVMIFMGF